MHSKTYGCIHLLRMRLQANKIYMLTGSHGWTSSNRVRYTGEGHEGINGEPRVVVETVEGERFGINPDYLVEPINWAAEMSFRAIHVHEQRHEAGAR